MQTWLFQFHSIQAHIKIITQIHKNKRGMKLSWRQDKGSENNVDSYGGEIYSCISKKEIYCQKKEGLFKNKKDL